MSPLSRRGFICRFAAVPLIAFPALARAQATGKVWRIGFLSSASSLPSGVDALRDGLRSFGYVEGRNLAFEFRWSSGKDDLLPELAADLVRLKVDVIVTHAGLPPAAAKRATSTIPIVTAATADPVGQGLVASLARPGGNLTGLSMQSTDLAGKRLQLLREILPGATRIAVLVMKGTPATPVLLPQLRAAALQSGITLVIREENEAGALAAAFAAMQGARAQALMVQNSPFHVQNRDRILALAQQHRLPTMFDGRESVDVGGLISYGPNIVEMFRRTAYYVDRIFKGANPADLPVEQPSKFEMVINLKTAKALGIKVPQVVLARADEVIQ